MDERAATGVLSEDEAVELLALMISSARLLMDEPAHYGPLRLLTATERLSAMILDEASAETRPLLELAIDRIPHLHTQMSDVPAYTAGLEELCAAIGDCLVRRAGLDEGGAS